jgi:hypothetical protein
MKPHWYRWQNDTLLLQLHVQTRRRRDEFKNLLNNRLCLYIKASPVEGKANQYLLGLIAKEFKVSKSRTEIIAGSRHRDKCVAIHSPTILPDWFLELAGKRLKNQGNF